MKTLVKCAVLGGITVFVWGMISWMALPWHMAGFRQFEHQTLVTDVLQLHAPESGLYVLPGFCCKKDAKDKEAALKKMKEGPFIFASVHKEGMNPYSPRPYIVSLVLGIVGAFLITWLLLKTLKNQKGLKYFEKVWFVTCIGLIVGLLGSVPFWNWWGFPLSFTLVHIIDMTVAWFLGGLVIAKFAK